MPSSTAKALEQVEFGGVDSRSNPLNMPRNRALRCLNWTVKPGGWLELRYGYSTVTQSSVVASTIHTLVPYTLFNQTRYVIRFQGTTPYQVAISNGTVTGPTFSTGTSFTSSAAGQSYQYNNHLYYGNGTDQNWFDGTTWRSSGLGTLTTAQALAISVKLNFGELTSAQETAVTVTQTAAAGNLPASVAGGLFFYVSQFSTLSNSLGPAVNPVGNGTRIVIAANNSKVTLANMPDTSGLIQVIKLISRTEDGTGTGGLVTLTAPTSVTSLSRSGGTVTVTAPAHGRASNDVVVLAGVSDPAYNGVWFITVVDANTFTFVMTQVANSTSATGGTVVPVLQVAAATTSVDVTTATRDTSVVTNDPDRGIPASTIGGATPGFQFYASIARVVNGTILHVGNRVPIGGRLVPTVQSLVIFRNLPSLADTEQWLLIGRTGDGAVIPYACVDFNGNFLLVPNPNGVGVCEATGTIDGNSELPFRNGIIPATCDKFAVVGDYVYAADSISATIRRSGSAQLNRNGQFLGDIAQSWAPNDIDTFPTNQTPTLLAETDGTLFVTTRTDCAFLVDNLGTPLWVGPYSKGGAGPRAWVKTDHGLFWVSWDKELCTIQDGKPVAVSDEYNAGELALLGDAFKATIELQYFRSVSLNRDELRVFGRKVDGTPHTVVVDFKLADARSPNGQGYSEEYLGPLAVNYTTAMVIDANNVRQLWAGDLLGNLYVLNTGADDVGNQYSADFLMLQPTGLERPEIGLIDFFGDGNTTVSYGRKLNSTVDQGVDTDLTVLTPLEGAPMQVPGRDDLVAWRVPTNDPEQLGHTYIRLQLTAHSADGNLSLNTLPHAPLETYGRIYLVAPFLGDERGRA